MNDEEHNSYSNYNYSFDFRRNCRTKLELFFAKIRTLNFEKDLRSGGQGKGLGKRNFCPPSLARPKPKGEGGLFRRRRISCQRSWRATYSE
jgi:hypothetical protein